MPKVVKKQLKKGAAAPAKEGEDGGVTVPPITPEVRKKLETARALMERGELDEALEIVDEIVDDDPMNDPAWRIKGEVHSRMGDEVMAELCAL